MKTEVLVRVAEEGAGAERLAKLAGALRTELLELDVDDVLFASGDDPPPGARAVDTEAAGALVASLNGSATVLTHLATTVRSWLVHRRDVRACVVELSVGGDCLRLSSASAEQQDRLIDAFVHAVAERR